MRETLVAIVGALDATTIAAHADIDADKRTAVGVLDPSSNKHDVKAALDWFGPS